jgi:lysophospholipase L1-like esterase
MKDYAAYIALGDSMSIDLYPALDRKLPPNTSIGAASLLYRNQTQYWPKFAGKDLTSLNPNMRFANLAEDGATTWSLLDPAHIQFLRQFAGEKVLVTITIGGNDALQVLQMNAADPVAMRTAVSAIVDRYKKAIAHVRAALLGGTFILTTVYDPTDGTGKLPGLPDFKDKISLLQYINDEIRRCARDSECLLADAHQRFFGRGLSVPPEKRYYWEQNPIEPSASGANALRALWLETLTAAGLITW